MPLIESPGGKLTTHSFYIYSVTACEVSGTRRPQVEDTDLVLRELSVGRLHWVLG